MEEPQQPPAEPAQADQPLPESLPATEVRPEREPFWGYTDLMLVAGLSIPCMLLGLGIVKGLLVISRIKVPFAAAELIPAQMVGYVALFGLLAVLFRANYDRPFWTSLGWVPSPIPPLPLISAGFVAAIAVAFAAAALRTPTTPNPMTDLMRERGALILIAVFGTTAGPLSEELLFRGFMQPLLVRSLGAAPGILMAAVPFGLMHMREYGNSWRHALLISAAGAAFGWVRHATGSTRSSTLMHAAYNALFFAASFISPKD
jgi:membrane protease YdiL (CAAX protease family)